MIRSEEEYAKVVESIRSSALRIPFKWGKIQNNEMDSITKKIFHWEDTDSILSDLRGYDNSVISYALRRWYIYKCSECDEYIFSKHDSVIKNPIYKDKRWDIKINDIEFDIKGTKIPNDFSYEYIIKNPLDIIKWFYERQSKEERYGLQNRLFLIHHSMVSKERSDLIRCAFKSKERLINDFLDDFNNVEFFYYNGAKAIILVIVEKERGIIDSWYPTILK